VSAFPSADSAPARTWVVCLCAEWCGTCRDYRAGFERIAAAHPAMRFAWVDIEDHADLADDFDVETFPTLLVASADGTHFLGPLLPHAETLTRLLGALPAAQPWSAAVGLLMAAIGAAPERFELSTTA
jgi:thioredoxin 1